MTAHERALLSALRATEVLSQTAYSWFGRVDSLPEAAAAFDAAAVRSALVERLCRRLYASFYCAGMAVPDDDPAWARPPSGWTPFMQALSDANTGTGSVEPGWRVHALEDGWVVVTQGKGPRFWARPEEIAAPARARLSPGTEVAVRLPKELRAAFPSHYMALGDAGLTADPALPVARFYWNLRSGGVAALVGAVTRALNPAGIPFRLKVLNDPGGPRRCDAAVLYVPWEHRHAAAGVVARIHPAIALHLGYGTPAFTKRLAPGVAFAEDPGGEDSFGMHRCRLVAEALVDGAGNVGWPLGQRLAAVARRFADAGVSLDRPHLQARPA